MEILNAQFTEGGSITATVDGKEMSIPAAEGNRHYAELVRQGITPAPYVAPPAAPIEDPDADIQSDIEASTNFVTLKAALLGQGPKGAKVRGRK